MSFIMEGYEGKGMSIGFENCEDLCVDEDCVVSAQFCGIKKCEQWDKQGGWFDWYSCEEAYISLKDLKPEHRERLLKYNDITTVQFQDREFMIDFEGDYNNKKQQTYVEGDILYINISNVNRV